MKQNLSEWGSFYWVIPIVILVILLTVIIEGKKYRTPILCGMLAIWLAGFLYLMFLYRLPGGKGWISLDFLHMYREAANYCGTNSSNQALRQIQFNILLFVPFGCIMCALTRRAWLTILIGIGLSILTEAIQYWTGLGMADVDDIVNNTLGIIIGVLLYMILNKGKQKISNKRKTSHEML